MANVWGFESIAIGADWIRAPLISSSIWVKGFLPNSTSHHVICVSAIYWDIWKARNKASLILLLTLFAIFC